ncbi:hypothetical protein HZA55_08770 [Candidatus Poribacteria bacterium]|nr:hypothetical protein [Candidatus Poribacteria bacterium]
MNKKNKGIILLIAGSFHFDVGKQKNVNRSTVLNYMGNVLWNHDKLNAFQITSDEIVKPKWAEWKNKIGLDVNGGEENICCGDSLSFFDSELGRIGISICLDYIYPKHMPMLQYSKINLFLVPCMSPTITRFKKSAETLGDCQQASLFLSNCGAIAVKDDNGNILKDGASFYYLPKNNNAYNFNESNELLKVFDLFELIKG